MNENALKFAEYIEKLEKFLKDNNRENATFEELAYYDKHKKWMPKWKVFVKRVGYLIRYDLMNFMTVLFLISLILFEVIILLKIVFEF